MRPQIVEACFSQRARSGHAGLREHFTVGVCFKQAVEAFTDKMAGGTYEIKVTEFNSEVKIDQQGCHQSLRPKNLPTVFNQRFRESSRDVAHRTSVLQLH